MSFSAGAFFRDYHDALMRDVETMPRFFMTGNGAAMAANRISHFFDFRGPSITVDTGCSTALAALHLGCQSLRTGDAEVSIIAGANLMLNPDMFISMSSLGFLSPDGKSYAFDSRANGYGRGEGVATVILKPLADAIRDGDPIRAVIRETALNQDGRTPTITSPSQEAQQALIRECYQAAGLDPAETAYVEAHGTGTQTGDPIEAAAIGIEFGKGRPSEKPLVIGSVKTNLGHCEASSGLAALIKVVMALENEQIPPSINFEKPNPKLKLDEWKLKIARELQAWPESEVKRASISNFGYGGCNAHVIVEHPDVLCGASEADEDQTTVEKTSRLFVLAAKDPIALQAQRERLAEHLTDSSDQSYSLLNNLAYTLGSRRSNLPWKVCLSARTTDELVDGLISAKQAAVKTGPLAPRIGFVFTGQGAQWHAMGRELISAYPVFQKTLMDCNAYSREFGVEWSLIDELRRSETETRVNDPGMSLVLCTAIQLSLVCLLRSWNVLPTAVTSHSSGEVAAAFAAGALDLRNAMAIPCLRTKLNTKIAGGPDGQAGAMLAAGIGREDAELHLQKVTVGKAVIACVNSPTSVTLSGDTTAIDEIQVQLELEKVFARKLKVGVAYHSHHMAPFSEQFTAALEQLPSSEGEFNGVRYTTPVTGKPLKSAKEIGIGHWALNMVSPVLFLDAYRNMCLEIGETPTKLVDVVVEVGPHGALSGPIRQIMQLPEFENTAISYASCLGRGQDAVSTMQALASELLAMGVPVDLNAVNFPNGSEQARVLTGLPTYPWTHSIQHWSEPSANKNHRSKKRRMHDLLGTLESNSNPMMPTWRLVLKVTDLPWVRDHQVQGSMIYPGAGFICMAIEGLNQLVQNDGKNATGFNLMDIDIKLGLVVPEEGGVELKLHLRELPEKNMCEKGWYQFHIFSLNNGGFWAEHCSGMIAAELEQKLINVSPTLQNVISQDKEVYTRRMEATDLYKGLRRADIYHGPIFQNLLEIRQTQGSSLCNFRIADTASLLPAKHEEPHVLHPTTLDSILQAAYSSLPRSSTTQAPKVPKTIRHMFVNASARGTVNTVQEAHSALLYDRPQGFSASVIVPGEAEKRPFVVVDRLVCQSLGSLAPQVESLKDDALCMTTSWQADLSLLSQEEAHNRLKLPDDLAENGTIADMKRAVYHYIRLALQELEDEDYEQFQAHQKSMFEWMKLQVKLAEFNILGSDSARWKLDSADRRRELFENVKQSSVNGEMTCRVGEQLVPILRNELAPLALMLEGQLLYKYYEKDLRMQRSYVQVNNVLKLFAHKSPAANVLEIGAGTGGCTRTVLNALGGGTSDQVQSFAHYDFTDISSGFFGEARKSFAAWGDQVSYKKLDVELDPTVQGFQEHSYDLIVACRVLHATRSMQKTLENVHRLLKPGGKLLMVEDTQDALDTQLVFGVLPGWWLGKIAIIREKFVLMNVIGEEDERIFSPTLRVDGWKRLLKKSGFTGLDIVCHDREDDQLYSSSVLLSTSTRSDVATYSTNFNIVLDKASPPASWVDSLRRHISDHTGRTVKVSSLAESDATEDVCVVLEEIVRPILAHPASEQFSALVRLLTMSKGVMWVSRGGTISCPIPEAAMHVGILRTLRCENSHRRHISLDLDPRQEPWSAHSVQTIAKILKLSFDESIDSADIETEMMEASNVICIPRIVEDTDEDAATLGPRTSSFEKQPFLNSSRKLQMIVEKPGLLDSIAFKDISAESMTLPEDFVEIEPKAFGLNFRDVMVAMGQLDTDIMGFECSGIVQAAGKNTKFKAGDRVCALMRGHWSNVVRLHGTSVAKIPDEMSFETATTIPMVFITAYFSLVNTARLERGESILIHAAAGGVGQAAIMLAQHIGAEVFVTAGSEEKRAFLAQQYGLPMDHILSSRDSSFASDIMAMTDQRGVDVILNSLSGALLKSSWHCVAQFGRFVEIGKRDIEANNSLDLEPFLRNVTFSSVDLIQLGQFRGEIVERVLSEVLVLLNQNAIRPVTPTLKFSVSEMEWAMRTLQAGKHWGKIVVVPNEEDLVDVQQSLRPVRLSPDATYLLVGGAGGIGMSIMERLASAGAKHLLLLSRSAGRQAETNPSIRKLQESGCNVEARDCDVADAQALGDSLEWCRKSMPPIRGIIQAAMVLRDSIFETMSLEDYMTAIRPKVAATFNLHYRFAAPGSLDFFVTLSSFAAVGGNASQANYAAGGVYQDALTRHRASIGLPAVDIDLGMVKSIGYVAETKGVAERLSRAGYRPLEEAEVMSLIDSALRNPLRSVEDCQIITGVTASYTGDTSATPWRLEPRFRGLRQAKSTVAIMVAGTSEGALVDLRTQLAAAESQDDATETVCKALIRKLSNMFMVPEADIKRNLPMSDFGVDSLVAVELRNWLVGQTRAEISIFDLMQSPNLLELAEKTAKGSKLCTF
ncbi:putative polyketide synthase [Aureobasidium subglaciale]|nr:putative polyketide synthase [Aureobasidium subglaciale]KAI5223250.1 putative polyketide synthase [Aureobasidium subglaciale]KAI5259751.1 putative polyketide synthase [Aureobasidium subglaciale]